MRAIAALKLPRRTKDVVAFAKSVATAMTGNPSLPSPNPPLATLEADVAALDAAEAQVLTGTHGAAEARDDKLEVVEDDLRHELAYVQGVADASPATAESIIRSAGMTIRSVPSRNKDALVARPGPVSGTAELVAKAVQRRAAYEWQASPDQKTWTLEPSTLSARTVVTGLPVGAYSYFRFRAVTKDGEGNWSQVVSLLVG